MTSLSRSRRRLAWLWAGLAAVLFFAAGWGLAQWGGIFKSPTEKKWKQAIRAKLERKVSFELVDSPLDEQVAFFRSLTKLPIKIDPSVSCDTIGRPSNLKVEELPLELALLWISKLDGLDYELRDRAIVITKRSSSRNRSCPLDGMVAWCRPTSQFTTGPITLAPLANRFLPATYDGKLSLSTEHRTDDLGFVGDLDPPDSTPTRYR